MKEFKDMDYPEKTGYLSASITSARICLENALDYWSDDERDKERVKKALAILNDAEADYKSTLEEVI